MGGDSTGSQGLIINDHHRTRHSGDTSGKQGRQSQSSELACDADFVRIASEIRLQGEFPAAEVAEVAWEENLLRHSFGIYHVVHHRNASLTAEIMGNSPGIVRAHYPNTAATEAAAAWWAVLPADTSSSKRLPIVATSRRAG